MGNDGLSIIYNCHTICNGWLTMVGRCGMFGKILGLGRCISTVNIVGVGSFSIVKVIDNCKSIVFKVVVIAIIKMVFVG